MKRPVLRYFGGKYLLAKWIVSHFPKHKYYMEPFGGAASVLMRKERCKSEIYNDLDKQVVNVFRVLRNEKKATELKRLLELTPFSRTEFLESMDPHKNDVEFARRTIVRSFMGFGGEAFYRKTGFRLSPNSNRCPEHDWQTYPEQIEQFSKRLKGVVIENRNAFSLIETWNRSDALIYRDPPYVQETRREQSYRHELSNQDHERLVDLCLKSKAKIVLSGYQHPIYNRLKKWKKLRRSARTNNAKKFVTEFIWLNERAMRG